MNKGTEKQILKALEKIARIPKESRVESRVELQAMGESLLLCASTKITMMTNQKIDKLGKIMDKLDKSTGLIGA